MSTKTFNENNVSSTSPTKNCDIDEFTSSSILDFLAKEQECYKDNGTDDNSELDVESIFEEINRLSGGQADDRSVEEIIREAERLISKQTAYVVGGGGVAIGNNGNGHVIKPLNKTTNDKKAEDFNKLVDTVQLESVISQESTPKDMKHLTFTQNENDDDTLEGDDDLTDTVEEITEGIDTMELTVSEGPSIGKYIASKNGNTSSCYSNVSAANLLPIEREPNDDDNDDDDEADKEMQRKSITRPSPPPFESFNYAMNVMRELETTTTTGGQTPRKTIEQGVIASTPPTAPFALATINNNSCTQIERPTRVLIDKSTNSSPKRCVSAITSPIDCLSITREHALKHEMEQLQERLKDTEERLQSLRIQHDTLSHLHRDLRENNTQLQDQSELLKLDVQHLTECTNILRSELHSARNDRNEALELQRILQSELEESRDGKKKAVEQNEKDSKVIQDLQRQCKEMERILMRKHPDSVSALIVASRNPSKTGNDDSSTGSRRLLEQRIAQLESDAKEQDLKAQKILANVQARFNSVQSKYETHIADLETQVLSLQEINAKLNAKIEAQVHALDTLSARRSLRRSVSSCTQTEDDVPTREAKMLTTATQTDPVANSTSNRLASTSASRPSGLKKPSASSKIPSSHSESTTTAYHAAAKEDAHLLATIRGMRVDLAIKDKAMQRLTRELDECKKTIRKLQKERDVLKTDKPHSASSQSSSSSRKTYDPSQYSDQASDSQALKEALNKIKLLEFDYKALHDKRLQDLKTLQTAHERELASCHETVRILQQRLTERDEVFAMQNRRKVPVDYYALKAKVSSLERRHSEREERLHMLVEALSKGRLNGALDDILNEATTNN